MGRELHAKFGLQKLDNLKLKHVEHLVESMKAADAGRRSIESKLSHLRWLLRKIGKPVLLPRSNEILGIAPGPRHTRAGKIVTAERMAQILEVVEHPRIRVLILLARHFGLRFEEASLLRPHVDFDGKLLWVKRGTKGGRPRYVRAVTLEQMQAIRHARTLTTGSRGLIPKEYATYAEWRAYVYAQLRAIGIGRRFDVTFHDLRRSFATERMRVLVRADGYSVDRAASVVSRELGHARTEILAWYVSEDELERLGADADFSDEREWLNAEGC